MSPEAKEWLQLLLFIPWFVVFYILWANFFKGSNDDWN